MGAQTAERALCLPGAVHRDTFKPEDLETYEVEDAAGEKRMRIVAPENVVRWRYKLDENGCNVMDENEEPVMESNANLVEWSDCTTTLAVGKEHYQVLRPRAEKTPVFEEQGDIKVLVGFTEGALVCSTASLDQEAHKRLKDSQVNKVKPQRKTSLVTSTEVDAIERARMEFEPEEKKKVTRRRNRVDLGDDDPNSVRAVRKQAQRADEAEEHERAPLVVPVKVRDMSYGDDED